MTVKKSLKVIKQQMMSPLINPLMEPQELQIRKRLVQSGRGRELIDAETGEVSHIATIRSLEDKDDAEFVKVFADGIAASYQLTKTAQRVFQVVLDLYQRTPMSRGYADSVELYWFGNGIEGRDVGLSESTWNRGLRELLDKRFLWPKTSSSYWINAALFFKGDRVRFVKEYRRRSDASEASHRMQHDVVEPQIGQELADAVYVQRKRDEEEHLKIVNAVYEQNDLADELRDQKE